MSWANIGAALKGVGDTARSYDLQKREMEERKFLEEQRAQQRAEWEKKTRRDKELAGIVMPGQEYEEPTPLGAGEVGPPVARKGIQTPRRYMDQVAGALQRSGDVTGAIQMRNEAQRAEDAAYNRHIRQVNDTIWKARRASAQGDLMGAMRTFQKAYDMDNDGYKIVIEGDKWGVAGPNAQFVRPLEKITPDAVKLLTEQAVEYMSPEMWQAVQNRNFKRDELGLRQDANNINRLQVQNTGAYQQGMLGVAQREAGIKAAQADMSRFGKPEMFMTAPGTYGLGTPVLNPKTGAVTWVPSELPAGWTPIKQGNPLSPELQAAVTKMGSMIQAGTIDPKDTQAVRQAYRAMGVDPDSIIGPDPRMSAYANIPPPAARGGANSAPAPTPAPAAPKEGPPQRGIDPNSPAGRSAAARAAATAERESAYQQRVQSLQQQATAALNAKDLDALQAVQDASLFTALPAQLKNAVVNAIKGR